MKLFVKYGIFLFASVIALNSYNIKADESSTTSTDTNVSDTKEPATHENRLLLMLKFLEV